MTEKRNLCCLLGLVLASAACGGETVEEPVFQGIEVPCRPTQQAPYADGIPYLGIHADAGNSDIIRCQTGSEFAESWHALAGLGAMQPNTFSRDGATTYVTTTNPNPDGCRLHALDARTGALRWCASYPGSIARSAVEVDRQGDLYFTVASRVVSTDDAGKERWSTGFDVKGEADAPWGLHFTPDGHIATVTSSGMIYLLNRSNGKVLAELSIREAYNFVMPGILQSSIDVTKLMPAAVQSNIASVWGTPESEEDGPGFASFLGAGNFVDNTLAVSPEGHLYIIGGGPSEDEGALVQVRVTGDAAAPKLEPGWFAATHKGSATSPSISPKGQYVMISDGVSPDNTFEPEKMDARVKVFDIGTCDLNMDSDPDPSRCGLAYEEKLERGTVPGSPAIDDAGWVYFYEFGMTWSWQQSARDVVAFGPNGIVWSTALPDNMDWTSVATVTDNHVIGTATTVVPSDKSLPSIVFPETSEDHLVMLDRATGEVVFRHPVPDDSAATVTVGPDGSLYVGMLGLVSILSVDEAPTLGVTRLVPITP